MSKDSDFHQLAFAEGPPPKVIWIQRGNCSTGEIAEMLNRYCEEIFRFVDDEVTSLLALR